MHFSVYAKMVRFSRNLTKFCFAKICRFRENLVYFSRKFTRKRKTPIFAKILSTVFFAKMKNADFCEKYTKSRLFFAKFLRKRKTKKSGSGSAKSECGSETLIALAVSVVMVKKIQRSSI
jgi:hypothetical protein